MLFFLPTTIPPTKPPRLRKRGSGDERPEPPRRLIKIDFCCNDPDNGCFTGRFSECHINLFHRGGDGRWSIHAADPEAELELREGYPVVIRLAPRRVRIGRRWYPYIRRKEWHGNWCWDSYFFEFGTGMECLNALRDSGKWSCSSAETEFYRWWNGKTEELPECLR
jgi:hypothetical protein